MGILWTAALLSSLIQAGGGADGFSTQSLVHYLADVRAASEMRSLSNNFGDDNVASFTQVFDFAVADVVQREAEAGQTLPPPDPSESGETLSTKLYQAGLSNGSFNTATLLDALFSHPLTLQLENDIDAKYGAKADANFQAVLMQLVTDLKNEYS